MKIKLIMQFIATCASIIFCAGGSFASFISTR